MLPLNASNFFLHTISLFITLTYISRLEMLSQRMYHYFTACFVIMLIIHSSSTPYVEAGLVTYVACVLAC